MVDADGIGLGDRVLNRAEELAGSFKSMRFGNNLVNRNWGAGDGDGLNAAIALFTPAKGLNQKTAGLLYNLGYVGGDFNDDPANVGGGAQAFAGGDGNNYDLQDARPVGDIARGLQGFVALKSTERNPLSNDGRGT